MAEKKSVKVPDIDVKDTLDFEVCSGDLDGYVKITRDTKVVEYLRIENAMAVYNEIDKAIQNLDDQKSKLFEKQEKWRKGVTLMQEKQKAGLQ